MVLRLFRETILDFPKVKGVSPNHRNSAFENFYSTFGYNDFSQPLRTMFLGNGFLAVSGKDELEASDRALGENNNGE